MVSMRILLWIWNNPLRMQIFKGNNTYFVILVNSRVERAVRGDEWKDFCGENCGLNLSLLHSFWRRIGVGRSNFLISSLVKNLQENHSHSFKLFPAVGSTKDRWWIYASENWSSAYTRLKLAQKTWRVKLVWPAAKAGTSWALRAGQGEGSFYKLSGGTRRPRR